MAVQLILRTMAEKRDVAFPGKLADQSKGEFLPVILDSDVARVKVPVHEQFGSVSAGKLRPGDASGLDRFQCTLARSERRHPHVISRGAHPAAAKPRRQNPQSVALRIDRTRDR